MQATETVPNKSNIYFQCFFYKQHAHYYKCRYNKCNKQQKQEETHVPLFSKK